MPTFHAECRDSGSPAFPDLPLVAAPRCPPPGLEDVCTWQPVHQEMIKLGHDGDILQDACTVQQIHPLGRNRCAEMTELGDDVGLGQGSPETWSKTPRVWNDLMGEASTYVTTMERCGLYREGIGLTVVAILRDVFSTWHCLLENRARGSLEIASTCYEWGLKSLGDSGSRSAIISKFLQKGMDYAEVDTEVCMRLHALFMDALKWAGELDRARRAAHPSTCTALFGASGLGCSRS